jgi:hypothetical protein
MRPSYLIQTDTKAITEASRLTLSQILDRQMELEKTIARSEDAAEVKQARVLLHATYVALQQRYRNRK